MTRRVRRARVCVDCRAAGITTRRNAKFPGPRCASHHKAVNQNRSTTRWEAYILEQYGITGKQYWEIYELQGRCCYICRRAKGQRKRLAVDHDHNLPGCIHPPEKGCVRCVRGLLCATCNRRVVGHLRDDPEAFERGAFYLRFPPAQQVLRAR